MSYKIKLVRIPIGLDELVNVSVDHPFRRHRKMPVAHCHSQQWEYVWMAETFPRHHFLAEPLCSRN